MDDILTLLEAFLTAQKQAEQAGEPEFLCPLCGGVAAWKRDAENGHLRCGCKACGFRVIE